MTQPTAHPRVGRAQPSGRALGRLAGIGIALVLVAGSFVSTPRSAAATAASGPALTAACHRGHRRRPRHQPARQAVPAAQPHRVRLPAVLAARLGHGRPAAIRPRLDDRVLRSRDRRQRIDRADRRRREGLPERQRDRGDERRACRGRPGRPDVPALRRRRPAQDDRVPRQHDRPEPVHRPGPRPHGPALGGRREPRLRAAAGDPIARLPRVRRPVRQGDAGPHPGRPARRRDLGRRRRRRSITGLVPARRPDVRDDLQLPLERFDDHRCDRARSTTPPGPSRSTSAAT